MIHRRHRQFPAARLRYAEESLASQNRVVANNEQVLAESVTKRDKIAAELDALRTELAPPTAKTVDLDVDVDVPANVEAAATKIAEAATAVEEAATLLDDAPTPPATTDADAANEAPAAKPSRKPRG